MRKAQQTTEKKLNKVMEYKKDFLVRLKSGEEIHVKCQNGNSKTGKNVRTVSLIPIIDCQNCSHCSGDCYDINNDFRQFKQIYIDRARNSAIHEYNIRQYWEDVELDLKYNCTTLLRVNVGGDCIYEDFCYLRGLAERTPKCEILLFTKNYDDVNLFLDQYNIPSNLHILWSRWQGLEGINKHNLPEAHILKKDGTTTAPEYGAYLCQGDCSYCHYNDEGCWNLKAGESVIFKEH